MYIVKKRHESGILKGITTTEQTDVKYTPGQTYNEYLTGSRIAIVSVKDCDSLDINNDLISYLKMVHIQGHAKQNAIDAIAIHAMQKRYGKDWDVLLLWDMDKDIISQAEIFTNAIYENPAIIGIERR